jgi:hypothetical protein
MSDKDFPSLTSAKPSAANIGAWGKGIDNIRKIAPVPAPPAKKIHTPKKKTKVSTEAISSDDEDDDEYYDDDN